MAAEQGDKNEQISDGDRKLDALADMIRDACAKIDEGQKRLDARMDAIEEETKKSREDSTRRDARKDEDEEEEMSEPKGDSEEEQQKSGVVEDRKDADEEEEEMKADADEEEEEKAAADAFRMSSELADLRAQIAALNARAPAIISDRDRERYAAIQEQADSAFQAFGDRAPGPLDGETPLQYKRRLATKLQAHSPRWKDARLSAIADDATLETVVADIYADSLAAARKGVAVPAGQLREVSRQVGGHTIIEFEGGPDSWMNSFAGNSQRGTGNWLRPH